MRIDLSTAVFLAGIAQLCVLIASSLVPLRLEWKSRLADLPTLVRQLFWVYGGYTVLSITSLGVICLFNSKEIAEGGGLARSFCCYGALFWGIRLSLQPFLNAKPFLTTWWLLAGYHLLTIVFTLLTATMVWGIVH